MRLDEEKLEALRRFGEALRRSGGDEHAPAGRAIQMLIEEIDRLQHELSHARQQPIRVTPVTGEDAGAGQEEPALTLHERLQQTLEETGEAGSAASGEKPPASSQSWIESLRRRR